MQADLETRVAWRNSVVETVAPVLVAAGFVAGARADFVRTVNEMEFWFDLVPRYPRGADDEPCVYINSCAHVFCEDLERRVARVKRRKFRRDIATLGGSVGFLKPARQSEEWPISNSEGVVPVSARIGADFQAYAQPFFEAFATRPQLLNVFERGPSAALRFDDWICHHAVLLLLERGIDAAAEFVWTRREQFQSPAAEKLIRRLTRMARRDRRRRSRLPRTTDVSEESHDSCVA